MRKDWMIEFFTYDENNASFGGIGYCESHGGERGGVVTSFRPCLYSGLELVEP